MTQQQFSSAAEKQEISPIVDVTFQYSAQSTIQAGEEEGLIAKENGRDVQYFIPLSMIDTDKLEEGRTYTIRISSDIGYVKRSGLRTTDSGKQVRDLYRASEIVEEPKALFKKLGQEDAQQITSRLSSLRAVELLRIANAYVVR